MTESSRTLGTVAAAVGKLALAPIRLGRQEGGSARKSAENLQRRDDARRSGAASTTALAIGGGQFLLRNGWLPKGTTKFHRKVMKGSTRLSVSMGKQIPSE
ncbi:hypothetical protein B296_00032752 [Ensete ventricosum]|uniref:Uncharacterized protein n=1 Tax=Ensete ventricosum TaxID=4639 RepID=A0A427ACR4_ENSVE|nr:hypothetical protein B296_00032752 [Ensete ventricosum]